MEIVPKSWSHELDIYCVDLYEWTGTLYILCASIKGSQGNCSEAA